MTRTENDLRDALQDLDRRAAQQDAPSTAHILARATAAEPGHARHSATRRLPRWLPPLAAAAAVASVAVAAVALNTSNASHTPAAGAPSAPLASPTASSSTSPTGVPTSGSTATPTTGSTAAPAVSPAAAILDDAATKLDAAPAWTTPAPRDFFYVRTTEATTWSSVSGKRAGSGRSTDGTRIDVPGCADGQLVSSGQSGSCTLDDVPHYLGDAPTTPAAWDDYLERMAPGAKAADAQGKIIVEVLHQDLTAPKATAALLRYTAGCPGLHAIDVRPVAGRQLSGVTCTSMTNGSYGLVFDATSHAFVGFVVVTAAGVPDGPAEIVQQTGIVTAPGVRP